MKLNSTNTQNLLINDTVIRKSILPGSNPVYPKRSYRVADIIEQDDGRRKCIIVDIVTNRPYSFWVNEEDLEFDYNYALNPS